MEARDAIRLVKGSPGVSYLTDAECRILAVSPGWETFAEANDGTAIANHELVRGRDLRSFLEGEQVRAQFEILFKQVMLNRSGVVSYPFRCDSADTIRRMRLTMRRVHQQRDGAVAGVLFESDLVESHHYEGHDFVLGMQTQRGEGSQQPICAYCLRVEWPPESGNWIEHQEAETAGVAKTGRLSHGACPSCMATLMSGMD